jgi:DNA-binding transcriptional MerR regulator
MKDVLSIGQVAKICGVSPNTAQKWFDSGALPGFRVPDSRARRVLRTDLIRFLQEHGVPLDQLAGNDS